MNRSAFRFSCLVLVFFSVPLVFQHARGLTQESLVEILPEDGEAEGWNKHRALRHYEGKDLYEYINGGAEIYHEFGFVQVVVQDYIHQTGKSISVEIFEMDSPYSAFGIYTFKTDPGDKRIPLGTDAQLADYYMNFWTGPFLVTLTGFDETDETRQGLLDIANRMNSKLTPGGEKPPLVGFLPEKDLVDQSLKYFSGILGLRSSHPFFYLDIAGYEQGIKGDYSSGYSLFIFRFGDEEACLEGLARLEGQKDRKGRIFFAAIHGEYLMLLLGDIDHRQAKDMFERTRQNIRSH